MGFDDGSLSALIERDAVAQSDEAPLLRRPRKEEEKRLVKPHSLGQANDCAVRHECRVEGHHGFVAGDALSDALSDALIRQRVAGAAVGPQRLGKWRDL